MESVLNFTHSPTKSDFSFRVTMHHIGAFQKKRTKDYAASNDMGANIFDGLLLSAFSPGFCFSIVISYFLTNNYAEMEKTSLNC